MEIDKIARLDHHGVVFGTIKDLGIIEVIDDQLQKNDTLEIVSPGETVSGMILNGLGFVSKPLYLSPNFFQKIPVQHLFGKPVSAEHFNAHKLSRTLDAIYDYGCERLFYLVSAHCCLKEKVDLTVSSNDTTSFSVTGNKYPNRDDKAVEVRHGHSKDHRPDLRQVVHEMMVSQDGGIPLMMKTHDGNASDNTIFKARSECLLKEFGKTDACRHVVMDSKLYTKNNAENLKHLGFVTRIPSSINEEKTSIKEALSADQWKIFDKDRKYYPRRITHNEIDQRWLVIYSKAAENRAKKSIARKIKSEAELLGKKRRGIAKEKFSCKNDAESHLKSCQKKWKWHQIDNYQMIENEDKQYEVEFSFKVDEEKESEFIQQKSCFVIGTNLSEEERCDEEVIKDYKGQNTSVERGFRFLKDSLFFVEAIFLKTPRRIMALLTVMTLALLVFSLAERRMRAFLAANNESLVNQLGRPTQRPTLRWLFQLLEGIHLVCYNVGHRVRYLYDGLDDLRTSIVNCFGDAVKRLYGLA